MKNPETKSDTCKPDGLTVSDLRASRASELRLLAARPTMYSRLAIADVCTEAADEIEQLRSASAAMLAALKDTVLQLQYLADKFGETGSGAQVLARVNTAIAKASAVGDRTDEAKTAAGA